MGLYILDSLSRIVAWNRWVYIIYNGIIYIPNSNGRNSSRIQRKIIKAFKFLGFKIEVSSNNKIVNFLDVPLNLSNNTYKLFLKIDQYPSYSNLNSNHPKTIIKQVPKTVKLRIRNLSPTRKYSKRVVRYIWMPLKIAAIGRVYLSKNVPNDINKENKKYSKKNRKRKIIWFNPPFCRIASINVGNFFLLKLIDKHFKHNNIIIIIIIIISCWQHGYP